MGPEHMKYYLNDSWVRKHFIHSTQTLFGSKVWPYLLCTFLIVCHLGKILNVVVVHRRITVTHHLLYRTESYATTNFRIRENEMFFAFFFPILKSTFICHCPFPGKSCLSYDTKFLFHISSVANDCLGGSCPLCVTTCGKSKVHSINGLLWSYHRKSSSFF